MYRSVVCFVIQIILFIPQEVMAMAFPEGKFACTVTVGEKGQIVIPKQARLLMGIHPGDTLILLGDKARGLAIPPKDACHKLFDEILQAGSEEAGTK